LGVRGSTTACLNPQTTIISEDPCFLALPKPPEPSQPLSFSNKQRQQYITPDVAKQYFFFPIFPSGMSEKALKGNYDDFLYGTLLLSP
jgi:hypothetical protein